MPLRPRKLFDTRFVPYYLLGAGALAFSSPSGPGLCAGFLLVAAGAGLRGWAAGHLVKTERLTITGPYAHLRHPLYLGTLLIAAGYGAIAGGWLAGVGLPLLLLWFFAFYFPRKERIESARLERGYGEVYRRYRAEVPALWPSLQRWVPPGGLAAGIDGESAWRRERFVGNNEQSTTVGVVAGAALLGALAAVAL